MEELIELLNEYSKNIGYFNEEDLQGQTKAWILSKEFGWIGWLVDKDKINRPKFFDAVSDYCEDLVPYPAYETLPMLLAISNSPVEDLILYLK